LSRARKRKEKKNCVGSEALPTSIKEKYSSEVSGDQGNEYQYPIPGLDDDLQQTFPQERVLY